MNTNLSLFVIAALLPLASAQDTGIIKKQDIVYAEPASPLHSLDVHASPSAKNAPVVFWIRGDGWQEGDKSDVAEKPRFFWRRAWCSYRCCCRKASSSGRAGPIPSFAPAKDAILGAKGK